jgi:hypothetical protein
MATIDGSAQANPAGFKDINTMERAAVVTPNQVDILCGLGQEAARHPGNASFRQIVLEHFDEYSKATSKTSKMKVSRAILRKIISSGARFLKKEDSYWYVADVKVGKDKISHVLREMKRAMNRVRENRSSIPHTTVRVESKLGRQQATIAQRQQQQAMTARAPVYHTDAAAATARMSQTACCPEQRDAASHQTCQTGQTARTASAPTGASSSHHDMKTAGDMQASALHLQQATALSQQFLPKNANNRPSDHFMNYLLHSLLDDEQEDNVFAAGGSTDGGSDEDSKKILLGDCFDELVEDSPPEPKRKTAPIQHSREDGL